MGTSMRTSGSAGSTIWAMIPTRRLALEVVAVTLAFMALPMVFLPEVVADPQHVFWGSAAADAVGYGEDF